MGPEMDDPEDDEPEFRKGDYVAFKGGGESGRIVGPGSAPGTWRVTLVSRAGPAHDQEREVLAEHLGHYA